MSYLNELNEVQRAAVEQYTGPVLVIAGPGSGKTRVLTYRIAHMMEQGVDPFSILALTFTNKAAREMKERIARVVGGEARNLWMGTFHSVFARLLRQDGHKLGYPANFSIYDTDDSRSLLKTIIKEMALNDSLYKANQVHHRISSAKNSLITAQQYLADASLQREDAEAGRPRLGEVYEAYAKRCFMAGAMDFDDLLLKTYQLLMNHNDILYKYQHKFKYVLIDEFQDTNRAQYEIVKMIGSVHENICVVGDDAQSIYSFRGANIENILHLERDYPDLKVFKLEQNYRSTKHIVRLANEVITKNKAQLPKKIWTDNDAGHKILVMRSASDNEEGRLVAEHIFEEKMRYHYRDDDFAILYRTNAQSRSFEEALRKRNIPYRVYGGVSFYQRKEIKDFMAYLRVIVNPYDEEALRRIINYPARGIGKTSIERLTVYAADLNKPLWDAVCQVHFSGLPSRAATGIEQFATMIDSFKALQRTMNAYELAVHVGKSTQLLQELYNDKSVEGLSRYENVQELLNSIKEFVDNPPVEEETGEIREDSSTLGTYLQQVTLLTDMDNEEDDVPRVKLMTIHAAKGLEFPVVYTVGLEENLFPSMMALNDREDLEEERRLFYVATTRAMYRLVLTYANTRYRFGSLMYCEPSRFLEEIPSDIIEFKGLPMQPPTARSYSRQEQRQQRQAPSSRPQAAPQEAASKPTPPTTEYTHTPSAGFTADNPADMQTGMQVEHQRFGYGKIISLEGTMDNRIANIYFEQAGNKRIMLKYAKLHIVGQKPLDD